MEEEKETRVPQEKCNRQWEKGHSKENQKRETCSNLREYHVQCSPAISIHTIIYKHAPYLTINFRRSGIEEISDSGIV